MPHQLPHPEAQSFLKVQSNYSELFALHPSSDVEIVIEDAKDWEDEIRKRLQQSLSKSSFNVVSRSDTKLRVKCKFEHPWKANFQDLEELPFQKVTVDLRLTYRDKEMWRSKLTNHPQFNAANSNYTPQQIVAFASGRPPLDALARLQLPRQLRRPHPVSADSGLALLRAVFDGAGGLK